jgi:hypothetical protein
VSGSELLEHYLPEYDVSDSVACAVAADVETVWQALVEADLIDVGRKHPLVGLLGFARMLPEVASHLLHGERMPDQPERLRLKETTELPATKGGWVLLGERENDELALGLVGRFWRPVIEFAHVPAAQFRDFSEPGWAKTVYDLRVSRIGEQRTLLTATMRTATTDERAKRWFRRYWALGVGSGAHILVGGLLDVVRDQAESRAVERMGAGV